MTNRAWFRRVARPALGAIAALLTAAGGLFLLQSSGARFHGPATHLQLAAMLGACALAGIRAGEEPPAPLDESLVRHDDDELQRLGVTRLPSTLGDALNVFREDDVVHAALGDYVSDQLVQVKHAEWVEYRRHVSPWEQARYGE